MSTPPADRDKHQFRGKLPEPVERPEDHLDWIGPPTQRDIDLERDIAHLLDRIQRCESEIQRHGLWRVYASKVRMRSDAQLRRMAIEGLVRASA